jgi:hypothetical protein
MYDYARLFAFACMTIGDTLHISLGAFMKEMPL